MTSTLAILGRFSGDKAKAVAYCDDIIETYSNCRAALLFPPVIVSHLCKRMVDGLPCQCREEIEDSCGCRVPLNKDGTCPSCYSNEMEYRWDARRDSVTDADYRWQ